MDSSTVKVLGPRILVKKEQIDAGGMKLTPACEEDGQKNVGKIIAVGQVGLLARLRGVKKGETVYFRKFFTTNHGQDNPLVFVDLENIVGIK